MQYFTQKNHPLNEVRSVKYVKCVHLFSQGIDGFLNVGKVHGLHVADHWHHESLSRAREI